MAVTAYTVLFFTDPYSVTSGVRDGLVLCGNTLVPSLFPFLVISDYLVRSGLCNIIGEKLSSVTEKIFRLPGCSACVIIMSQIGGFPVGAKMISQLFENRELSQKQAVRMMYFCVNSGPAFLIGAIGSTMLSSNTAGIILFAVQTITSLLIGFVMRFFGKDSAEEIKNIRIITDSSSVTDSVASATRAMLGTCSWVLVFSSISRFLLRLTEFNSVFNLLYTMSEVTSGCAFACKRYPIFILSAILGWSGFAVHMQLMPYIKKIGMPIGDFLLSRVLSSIISLPVSWLLFRTFPCEVQTLSALPGIIVKTGSISVPASVAILLLGIFTIIDINLATERKV